MSAWVARRSGSQGGTGLSDNEYRLIREAMRRQATGQMTQAAVSHLMRSLAELREASAPKESTGPTNSRAPEGESEEAFEARLRRVIDGAGRVIDGDVRTPNSTRPGRGLRPSGDGHREEGGRSKPRHDS